MKKLQTTQSVESSAVMFVGTPTLRQSLVLRALIQGPQSRESLDRIASVSNAPELVSQLRRGGLGFKHLQCHRQCHIDNFGQPGWHGLYMLTPIGRLAAILALKGAP